MSRELQEYLQRPHVPHYLKPASTMIYYTDVNLSDPEAYKDENFKYHQYFDNLANNVSANSASGNTFFPSDSFPYYKTHRVARPVYTPRKFTDDTKEGPSSEGFSRAKKALQSFDIFGDVPTIFSEHSFTGLSYHSVIEMPDGIYIYGGIRALLTHEYEQKIREITRDFTIPPENIQLICDYDIPLPIEKVKIESMAVKPFEYLGKYLPGSKAIKNVVSLSNCSSIVTDVRPQSISSCFSGSSTNSEQNTFPSSLICSATSKLSDRYFMLYGGLDIVTTITYPDDLHCVIEKELSPNDEFWLFDVINCKFKHIGLSVHPTFSSMFPNSIPRFGHAIVSIPKTSDSNKKRFNQGMTHSTDIGSADVFTGTDKHASKTHQKPNSFSEPASMIVMGGYKLNAAGSSFIAMNDLWKCDLFLDDEGTAEQAVASPIGDFSLVDDCFSYIIDGKMNELPNKTDTPYFSGVFNHSCQEVDWPSPRGFFSYSIIEADELLKFYNWREMDNDSIDQQLKAYLHSPVPRNMTNLSDVDDNSDEARSSGSRSPTSAFQSKDKFAKTKPSLSSTNTILSRNSSLRNAVPTQESSQSSIAASLFRESPESYNFDHKAGSPVSSSVDTSLNANSYRSLKSKIFIVFGGSSTMYTKVVDDEKFDVYYNKSILNDFWCFDFKTVKWYNLDDHFKLKTKLAICGHTMSYADSQLTLIGGVEQHHYNDSVYDPVQAGVYNSNPAGDDSHKDKKIQHIGWELGKKCVFDFHWTRIRNANKTNFKTGGLKLQEVFDYYNGYTFDFEKGRWIKTKTALVQSLDFFEPWTNNEEENLKNKFIISGGMIEKDAAKQMVKLTDKTLVLTNVPVVFKDSMMIAFAPDVKMMDTKTNKVIDDDQFIIGNGIYELYQI